MLLLATAPGFSFFVVQESKVETYCRLAWLFTPNAQSIGFKDEVAGRITPSLHLVFWSEPFLRVDPAALYQSSEPKNHAKVLVWPLGMFSAWHCICPGNRNKEEGLILAMATKPFSDMQTAYLQTYPIQNQEASVPNKPCYCFRYFGGFVNLQVCLWFCKGETFGMVLEVSECRRLIL